MRIIPLTSSLLPQKGFTQDRILEGIIVVVISSKNGVDFDSKNIFRL